MDKKETKRPKKSQNGGKDGRGKRDIIISALLGGLVGALILGLSTYFGYYKPHLEIMSKELANMTEQTEIMSKELESRKIESELWVLRDARNRAEKEIEKQKAEGENATMLKQLQDSYDEGIKHASKARNYWATNYFPEAWDEIDKSREELGKIVPIIKDVTYEKTNGA